MNTSCLAVAAKLGSSRIARARLVIGPASTIVTWCGWACTCRIRNSAAGSATACACGMPSGSGPTAGSRSGVPSMEPVPPQAPFHGIGPYRRSQSRMRPTLLTSG